MAIKWKLILPAAVPAVVLAGYVGFSVWGNEKPEKGWKSANQEMKQLLENTNGPAGAKDETQAGTNAKAGAAGGRDTTGKQPPAQQEKTQEPQPEQRAEDQHPQSATGAQPQSAGLEVTGDPSTAEGSASRKETGLPRQSQKSVRNPPYPGDKQSSHPSNKNKEAPSRKLNLNTATVEQLQELPFIGESKAKAILEYRLQAGQFHKVEELKEVKGIGDKMLEKLLPFIIVAQP